MSITDDPKLANAVSARASECGIALVHQASRALCVTNVSFGCYHGTDGRRRAWVKNCRGQFICSGQRVVDCGFPPSHPQAVYSCACDGSENRSYLPAPAAGRPSCAQTSSANRTSAACSESYSRRGHWQSATETKRYGGWRCPLWEHTPTRFLCPDLPTRRYVVPGCSTPPALRLLSARQQTTIFFVGDSLSGQHRDSLACRVLQEAHEAGVRPALDRQVTPPWAHLMVSARPFATCETQCTVISARVGSQLSAPLGSLSLCHVPAGMWGSMDGCRGSTTAATELLLTRRIARYGDFLILNDGLWHSAEEKLRRLRSLLHQVNRSGTTLGQVIEEGSVGLLWRETTPQHFEGELTGAYRDAHANWYHSKGSHCAPVVQPERDSEASSLYEQLSTAGLKVVPLWEMMVSQWDMHLEQRTPHTATRGVDCTHWCSPSGVLEAWVDATLLAMSELPGCAAAPLVTPG